MLFTKPIDNAGEEYLEIKLKFSLYKSLERKRFAPSNPKKKIVTNKKITGSV